MEEKKDEEKFLSREEILRQAEMIEKEIENDESLKDVPFPEDLDRKVMEKIRLYEESRKKEESEAESENKDNLVRIKKKRPGVFLLVAVIAVLVFAFGINSVGSMPFFTKKSEYEVGDRDVEMLDTNKETNKDIEENLWDEEKVFQEIEDTFGIAPVRFGYVPEHMVFETSFIEKDINGANLIYKEGENTLEYQMMFDYNEAVIGYDIDEENLDEYQKNISGVLIKITNSIADGGKIQNKAQFTYNNVHYVINAVMDEKEFDRIIENLIFM